MNKQLVIIILLFKAFAFSTEPINLIDETFMYPDGSSVHIRKSYYYDKEVGKVPHGRYVTYRKDGSLDSEIIYYHGIITEKRNWNTKEYLVYERISHGDSRVTYYHSYYKNSIIKRYTKIQKTELTGRLASYINKTNIPTPSVIKSSGSEKTLSNEKPSSNAKSSGNKKPSSNAKSSGNKKSSNNAKSSGNKNPSSNTKISNTEMSTDTEKPSILGISGVTLIEIWYDQKGDFRRKSEYRF